MIYKGRVWKGDPDSILVFSNNHTSIMHHFRYNQVSQLAGNDVIREEVLLVKSNCIICKGYPDFILVFNSNHTSIMRYFRHNQVLPLAGNDVIVLSPLGGAASDA